MWKTSKRNNKRTVPTLCQSLCLSLLLMTQAASASVIELDFEGAGDFSELLNFYNQGFDSAGNQGTNFGVAFGSGAITAIEADDGSSGFTNVPSGKTILFFSGQNSWLNLAKGFSDSFSLMYSSAQIGQIRIFEGLNATGQLLGSFSLLNQFDRDCAGDSYFCSWDLGKISFSGTARSIDFSDVSNEWSAFDNLQLGLISPPASQVSAPATGFLLLLAGAVMQYRRRQRQSFQAKFTQK